MHTSPLPDTALLCLSVMAQLFERKTNPQQLRHLSGKGSEAFDETDILRAAGVLDLKAKAIQSEEGRLAKTPLPAIARARDGTFFILAKYAPDKVLIHRPDKGRPEILPAEEFHQLWTGRLILFTSRRSIKNLWRRFQRRRL